MSALQLLIWHTSRTGDHGELEASAPIVPVGYSDAYYAIRACSEGREVLLVVLDMAGQEVPYMGHNFGSFPNDEQAKTIATRDAYARTFASGFPRYLWPIESRPGYKE